MRLPCFSILALLGFSTPALADNVAYELHTPRVTCSQTSAQASATVRRVGAVTSVSADPSSHTVRVAFDDDSGSLNSILQALRASGFPVQKHTRIRQ